MREIKFRAWCNGSMIFPKSLGFDSNGNLCFIDTNNEMLNHLGTESKIVLMQYTGLNDKSGKEIYEGDVVSTNRVGKEPLLGKIIWKEFRCNFSIEHSPQANNDLYRYVNYTNEVEVIGNIYENPELIEM